MHSMTATTTSADARHVGFMIETWLHTSPSRAEIAVVVGYLVGGESLAFWEALEFAQEQVTR